MRILQVAEVRIDEEGRLLIRPSEADELYQDVYRYAGEVRWDPARAAFVCPAPREWSYVDWFQQARNAVRSELGCDFQITRGTSWLNVSEVLRDEITLASIAD
jgi:hypothetical protein